MAEINTVLNNDGRPIVLIADDHSVVRMGLRYILLQHFGNLDVEEAEDCNQVLQQLQSRHFTHLVLDLQLKDGNGLDIFTVIRTTYPGLSILIHSSSSEEVYGKMFIQKGAKGFLHKQSADDEVIKAFNLFFLGRQYISTEMEEILADERNTTTSNASNPFSQLSTRELGVLKYLLDGKTVKEISYSMQLKPTTVATYKKRIFEKTGVDNFIDLQNAALLHQVN